MHDIYHQAGKRIRKLRVEQNLTREETAEKADISSRFLSDIENGRKGFSAHTLVRIANCFSVPCGYIMTGESYRSFRCSGDRTVQSYTDEQLEIINRLYEMALKLKLHEGLASQTDQNNSKMDGGL